MKDFPEIYQFVLLIELCIGLADKFNTDPMLEDLFPQMFIIIMWQSWLLQELKWGDYFRLNNLSKVLGNAYMGNKVFIR